MTRKVDGLFCPLLFEALGVGSVTSVSPVPPCAESVVLACSRCYMHVGSYMCFGFQLSSFVLCGRQFNILAVVALPTFRSYLRLVFERANCVLLQSGVNHSLVSEENPVC